VRRTGKQGAAGYFLDLPQDYLGVLPVSAATMRMLFSTILDGYPESLFGLIILYRRSIMNRLRYRPMVRRCTFPPGDCYLSLNAETQLA
jgi:hypothetical protein